MPLPRVTCEHFDRVADYLEVTPLRLHAPRDIDSSTMDTVGGRRVQIVSSVA